MGPNRICYNVSLPLFMKHTFIHYLMDIALQLQRLLLPDRVTRVTQTKNVFFYKCQTSLRNIPLASSFCLMVVVMSHYFAVMSF